MTTAVFGSGNTATTILSRTASHNSATSTVLTASGIATKGGAWCSTVCDFTATTHSFEFNKSGSTGIRGWTISIYNEAAQAAPVASSSDLSLGVMHYESFYITYESAGTAVSVIELGEHWDQRTFQFTDSMGTGLYRVDVGLVVAGVGTVTLFRDDVELWSGEVALPDSGWFGVTSAGDTYSGAARYYADGLVTSAPLAPPPLTRQRFGGLPAHVRPPLSEGTALRDAILAHSPWALWMGDEASGNLIDSSPNGRTATVVGAPTYRADGPFLGGVNTAMSWGPSTRAAGPSATPPSTVTIISLVYILATITAATSIVSWCEFAGGAINDKGLRINALGQLEWYVFNGSERYATEATPIPTGWHLVAGVVGPTETMRVYRGAVDGSFVQVGVNAAVTTSYTSSAMAPFIHGGPALVVPGQTIRTAASAIIFDDLSAAELGAIFDTLVA